MVRGSGLDFVDITVTPGIEPTLTPIDDGELWILVGSSPGGSAQSNIIVESVLSQCTARARRLAAHSKKGWDLNFECALHLAVNRQTCRILVVEDKQTSMRF